MRSALLLFLSMLFLFLARDWFPGTHYLHIFELSLVSSISLDKYIYFFSSTFSSFCIFPRPCLHLLRSCHAGAGAGNLLFNIYASRPPLEQMCSVYREGALPPHQNRHPRRWCAAFAPPSAAAKSRNNLSFPSCQR